MTFPFRTTYLIISLIFNIVESSKIMGIFPMCTQSHYVTGFAIAKELASRGHEVTFVSCYPLKHPINNFRNVHVKGLQTSINKCSRAFRESLNNRIVAPATKSLANQLGFIMVEETLSSPLFRAILHSNETFDLVITEEFAIPGLLGVAAHFGAESLLVSSWRPSAWGNYYFGNPDEPSYVPFIFSQMTSPMSFFERCINLQYIVMEYLNREFVVLPKQNEILHKYLPNVPNIRELLHKQSLMLVNSHISLDIPVPLLPNVIEIGGYHVEEPKQLPNDLKKLMDEAVDGVIFFSFGSTIKSTDLQANKIQSIITTISKLKQIVLWKYDNESIVNKPNNLYTGNWFPQNDILAHPNVKVFITQGGMMSTIEAIYHGIPILGLPFLADQHANINRAVKMGYALKLSGSKFTEEEFDWALNELIYNSTYRETVKFRSKLIRDRPMKPLDTAVYWIEYVIRNGGSHFRSSAVDLYWFQRIMLDVYLLSLVVVFGFMYLLKVVLIILIKVIKRKNVNTKKIQ